jgi:hypothetical protein
METQIIKSGWVEKCSNYLKKWRKRWLVLTGVSLRTYKSESDQSKSTMNLELKLIIDTYPSVSSNSQEFIFTIAFPSKKYNLRTSIESETLAWLNLINHTRQGNRVYSFSSPNYYHESKVLSDISLISSFTRMKEILYNREEEMLSNLDEIYQVYINKANKEYEEISNMYEKVSKNYEGISKVLNTPSDIIMKVREVQNYSKHHLNLKDFESFSVSKLMVSIPEENIEKVLKSSINVTLGNPSERMVRRTHITRALKWRYTGERIDAITFSVNRDIILTGVGVCTPYKPNRKTFIKEFHVLKGASTNGTLLYKHGQKMTMENSSEQSVYKMVIDNPVKVKKDSKYTVYIINEGAHTYKCVDCVSSIEGPEKVVWTFVNSTFAQSHQSNRCDTVCGPIADFYYIAI